MKKIKSISKFLPCIILLACSTAARSADQSQDSDIKITMDFHNQMVLKSRVDKSKNPIELKNDDPDAHFFVFLENVSSKPVVISTDTIRFLYFEIIAANGKTQKITPIWKIESTPIFKDLLLSPRETMAVEIRYSIRDDLDDKNDVGKYVFTFPPPGKKETVMIRAVLRDYSIPMLTDRNLTPKQVKFAISMKKQIEKEGLWAGTAKSDLYKVILVGPDE